MTSYPHLGRLQDGQPQQSDDCLRQHTPGHIIGVMMMIMIVVVVVVLMMIVVALLLLMMVVVVVVGMIMDGQRSAL